MGDTFKVEQAGAVGPSAHAHDMTFSQNKYGLGASVDLRTLTQELETLRLAMKTDATDPDHDIAVSDIARAEKAAKDGDETNVMKHLKSAGQWALDVATKIGTSVAIEAIKQAL